MESTDKEIGLVKMCCGGGLEQGDPDSAGIFFVFFLFLFLFSFVFLFFFFFFFLFFFFFVLKKSE